MLVLDWPIKMRQKKTYPCTIFNGPSWPTLRTACYSNSNLLSSNLLTLISGTCQGFICSNSTPVWPQTLLTVTENSTPQWMLITFMENCGFFFCGRVSVDLSTSVYPQDTSNMSWAPDNVLCSKWLHEKWWGVIMCFIVSLVMEEAMEEKWYIKYIRLYQNL